VFIRLQFISLYQFQDTSGRILWVCSNSSATAMCLVKFKDLPSGRENRTGLKSRKLREVTLQLLQTNDDRMWRALLIRPRPISAACYSPSPAELLCHETKSTDAIPLPCQWDEMLENRRKCRLKLRRQGLACKSLLIVLSFVHVISCVYTSEMIWFIDNRNNHC
jgi:hypothetical protein